MTDQEFINQMIKETKELWNNLKLNEEFFGIDQKENNVDEKKMSRRRKKTTQSS